MVCEYHYLIYTHPVSPTVHDGYFIVRTQASSVQHVLFDDSDCLSPHYSIKRYRSPLPVSKTLPHIGNSHGKSEPILSASRSHQALPAGAPTSCGPEPRTYISRWAHIPVARLAARRSGGHHSGADPVTRSRRDIVSEAGVLSLGIVTSLTSPPGNHSCSQRRSKIYKHSIMI